MPPFYCAGPWSWCDVPAALPTYVTQERCLDVEFEGLWKDRRPSLMFIPDVILLTGGLMPISSLGFWSLWFGSKGVFTMVLPEQFAKTSATMSASVESGMAAEKSSPLSYSKRCLEAYLDSGLGSLLRSGSKPPPVALPMSITYRVASVWIPVRSCDEETCLENLCRR
ncbi:hypothetical protein GGR56DRAFT_465565 [Xylariaceae sp. FL0804]|nr:hypothetical protein GGR56DRAFT_465565 [Xylariaceae sp. FL0804]